MDDGIIVGVDQTQEWILPWWWHHYSQHNTHPVTFVDFGLTPPMKLWCKIHGNYVHLKAHIFAAEKHEVASKSIQNWEEQFGPRVWDARMAWFKKPLACLKSPYKRSIWIDIDCEIRSSLSPLFPLCDHSRMALSKDRIVPVTTHPIYNSGVIVFGPNRTWISEWADHCSTRNHEFGGDQEVLSQLISDKPLSIEELPEIWNWSRCRGPNKDALIFHWHGDNGRLEIAHQMEKLCLMV